MRRSAYSRAARLLVLAIPVVVAAGACTDDGEPAATLTDEAIPPPVGEADAGLVDMEFPLADGGTSTVRDLLDEGPVVLNFWASWCAPCVQEMPEFEEVHQELGDAVTFVGINVDDRPEDAADMIERTGITYLVGLDDDGSYAQAAGALSLPTTLIVDTDGTIAETELGQVSGDELRTLLAGVLPG